MQSPWPFIARIERQQGDQAGYGEGLVGPEADFSERIGHAELRCAEAEAQEADREAAGSVCLGHHMLRFGAGGSWRRACVRGWRCGGGG
jgi:hypothetical protein